VPQLPLYKLLYTRIAYTSGGKTDELALGFLETDYQYWYSRTQMLKDTSRMQYNFNLEWTWTNMIPRWQIKSLSMANDPITTGLSQEADVP